ncbi:MAG: group 1 truncated hemoglobin [Bdellovibrionales bacterium]|nr:group 1 truncated hemoglobin [Bdellovibrionales bacterium]
MDLYQRLPDKNIIKIVNDLFYDKVYEHPWLSLFFEGIEKEFISDQQTAFIIGAIGGPDHYQGRLPSNAHPHMMITNELFDLRKSLLIMALEEAQAPLELKETWLKIDEAFRRTIVKNSINECEKRYNTDKILDFQKPIDYKKTA